jgi:hypothetical protein
VEKIFVSATTSSLAFEALEGEDQVHSVIERLTFGQTFPFLRKAQPLAVKQVFHARQPTSSDEVVCVRGKMTVSF